MLHAIRPTQPWPLHHAAATRQLEHAAQADLPPHTLMQRAGLATARLALALAPHARTVWIACGPGNNGGDGLEAAFHLQSWGRHPVVTWPGEPGRLPADANASLQRARGAGVRFAAEAPVLGAQDLAIDALLGLGAARPLTGALAHAARQLMAADAPVLAIDLPSGLDPDRGQFAPESGANASIPALTTSRIQAQHTLSLLTLKPGLFTGSGRDAAGQVWFDHLGVDAASVAPTAWLAGPPAARVRAHASHKGSFGDVAVIGGAPGMGGAAVLAGTAGLHAGAGRVYVTLLSPEPAHDHDPCSPELMFRPVNELPRSGAVWVCGCGGGTAVASVLSEVFSAPVSVVLDADALNSIAFDPTLQSELVARGERGGLTVLTPHPLEAARLLGLDTAQVQADRLGAAQQLADRFGAVVVLKGSGSVVAAPGRVPCINPTGNARLATAGSGDVLAGQIGAALADRTDPRDAWARVAGAVFRHGAQADGWPAGTALTAGHLARG